MIIILGISVGFGFSLIWPAWKACEKRLAAITPYLAARRGSRFSVSSEGFSFKDAKATTARYWVDFQSCRDNSEALFLRGRRGTEYLPRRLFSEKEFKAIQGYWFKSKRPDT
ncbi:hypothetical protein GCM10007874_66030 [Labrys miyagiensis]|uniref:YcxB-like protein n=1 Tax=Labrys miyagiensis TaxID=346912 RepID=A0ABQ6CTA6_9HYPH|nr:hypothetical protein GCM10007874_66030 [Labrys miyagiensis]